MSLKDKEAFVVDLLNKGYTVREIAKLAHVSFTFVKKVRTKLTGEVNENQSDAAKNKQMSFPSQAFKLFLEGKSIVQVTIMLDLPTEQIMEIHSDYLTLQNMEKASSILLENRKNLGAYLKLFGYLNGNNIKITDLSNAVDLANNINNLKSEKAQLEFDIDMLMDTKKYYEMELDEIKNKYFKVR